MPRRQDRVRTPQGSGRLSDQIWVGKKPPTKALAWWYLSRAAKELLEEKRRLGFFGGVPGTAPYWMSQERGEMNATIEPLFYIKRALDQWETQAHARIQDYFGRRR